MPKRTDNGLKHTAGGIRWFLRHPWVTTLIVAGIVLFVFFFWYIDRQFRQSLATLETLNVRYAVEEYYRVHGSLPKDDAFFARLLFHRKPVDVGVRHAGVDSNQSHAIEYYPEKDEHGRYFVVNYAGVGDKYNKMLEEDMNQHLIHLMQKVKLDKDEQEATKEQQDEKSTSDITTSGKTEIKSPTKSKSKGLSYYVNLWQFPILLLWPLGGGALLFVGGRFVARLPSLSFWQSIKTSVLAILGGCGFSTLVGIGQIAIFGFVGRWSIVGLTTLLLASIGALMIIFYITKARLRISFGKSILVCIPALSVAFVLVAMVLIMR